ncbi:MAG: uracil-DNA glycosylase [Alphaproteobacteria bacterium]|nr:uracil-DNA glycosylase [Alphaproteobacteria bacterium]
MTKDTQVEAYLTRAKSWQDSPPPDCPRCPRLVEFRQLQQAASPSAHNQPVADFGVRDAQLLIVGLAPGRRGANTTGRPFTGDYAGRVLYPALLAQGFARGDYGFVAGDGLELIDCRITNAVRCLPPQNRPLPSEINHCRDYLAASVAASERLRVILALGRIAHESLLRVFERRLANHPFANGKEHRLAEKIILVDSYHCSQYNIFTRLLSVEQFNLTIRRCRELVESFSGAESI